jgi:hypothetical protein
MDERKLLAAGQFVSPALKKHTGSATTSTTSNNNNNSSRAPHARVHTLGIPPPIPPRAPPAGSADASGIQWYARPVGGVKPMYRTVGAGGGSGGGGAEGDAERECLIKKIFVYNYFCPPVCFPLFSTTHNL